MEIPVLSSGRGIDNVKETFFESTNGNELLIPLVIFFYHKILGLQSLLLLSTEGIKARAILICQQFYIFIHLKSGA